MAVKGGDRMAQAKVNFTFSMDKATRDSFSVLCDTLGLSMSSAANALIKQAVRDQRLELSAVDENGFTAAESLELQRRFANIDAGNYVVHDLIEGEA